MKYTATTISVKDLRFRAFHGVYPEERTNGNDFLVSVSLDYDAEAAMLYDDVAHAVNYAEVIDIIRAEMEKPAMLIEHVTARIASAILQAFPAVLNGTVSVTKLNPPVSTPNAGATFTASFSK